MKRSPDERAYITYDRSRAVWREVTWREIGERAGRFRAAMQALDLKKGDRVALLLRNGVDWVAFDMAALSLGLVVVPVHLRDSAFNIARILGATGARLLLVDRPDRWEAIAASVGPAPPVDHVWVSEAVSGTLPSPAERLREILPEIGAPLAAIEAGPEDIATIIYTSGATGHPKGVMLTHAAILWNAEAVTKVITPSQQDLFLSILPLAHAFERTVGYYVPMMAGATVAYARSAELLGRDFVRLRPSVFLGVPLLYKRSYAEIQRRAAGILLGRPLLKLAAQAGRRLQWERGRAPAVLRGTTGPLLRHLLGRKVLMAFGGRLRVAVSGGARLPEEVARLLVGLGLPLVEGYGLTEAGPVVTGTSVEDYLPGSAGRPLQGAKVRVSNQGELLVCSPGLMRGYWRDAKATAGVFEDGWLRTGDLGEIREGRVFIRGRLSDRIVLASGEKFDPEPVEAAILRDELIEQVCVLGDAKPFAVAVAVLAKPHWRRLADRLKADPGRPNAEHAKKAILKRMESNLSEFPRFAQVRNIYVAPESWTVDGGLLTPTLKVKRHAVKSKYEAALAQLYGAHPVFG